MPLTDEQRAAAQAAWVASLSRAKGCTALTKPEVGPILDAIAENVAALPDRIRFTLLKNGLDAKSAHVSDVDLGRMIRAVFDAREG